MLAATLITVGILQNTTVVHAQTQEELTAQFQTELAEYALTHSDSEVIAYANMRLEQMTLAAQDSTASGLNAYEPSNLFPANTTNFLIPGTQPGETYTQCWLREWEICRLQYNSSLYTSFGVGMGIGAACTGVTAGTGLIVCLSFALAAHGAGIAAAREQRRACEMRGQDLCVQRILGR